MRFGWWKKSAVDKDVIPTTVEQAIPLHDIAEDGIALIGKNLWSKTFKFTDINYETASEGHKENIFYLYSDILNMLDEEGNTKITINNRKINLEQFQKENMLKLKDDSLDVYREEYNSILLENTKKSSGIIQDKYITVTTERKTYEEARTYFNRFLNEFSPLFSKLGSQLCEIDRKEKLKIVFDFFHQGRESDFLYNSSLYARRGYSFKDAISPDCLEFKSDYFKIDNRYGRVMYLRDYANNIGDNFISQITEINRGIILSIDACPIMTDKAIRQGESKLLAVETNISNWQRKQNMNNNYSATIPYDMEKQREESRDFLNDLVARDQRMIPALITIVHTADTKEQLDDDTESIRQCARQKMCSMNILRWQQLEGLNTALPYGSAKISIRRTFTTESLAAFMPFRVQEVFHKNGVYFANNAISQNLIMINRSELLNGNSFITGVSGSGKSILAKEELINLYLSDDLADIIIIDPEREYGKIINALGGENIEISATSKNHINAMDINLNYDDGSNPVILKSEFILSLCEQAVNDLSPRQKSIIDRCTANLLNGYMLNGFKGKVPTFLDFYHVLQEQPESEANDIALALELFTKGSLDTFANETNVDTKNRLICYDIQSLGKQLMPIGMLVVLDNILNRITANKTKGRKTYIFIDEIYLLFRHEYSANFLFKLWKRVRKYGAFITGITQNVEDLLQSHTARTMLANSELVVMLNQAATDREELASLMGMSNEEVRYITNVDAGHGIVKVGGSLIPFVNKIPKNTKLYELMTTKFGE